MEVIATSGHEAMLRSAVLVVYAHWEGFVKKSCEYYIKHINERITRYHVPLTDHFYSFLLWQEFRKQGDHQFWKNPAPFIDAVRSFFSTRTEKDTLPFDILDAESNLSSKVLKKLIVLVDIDYGLFKTKEKLIDENLLDKRNRIAHGERITIKLEEYTEIEREVRDLIDIFQKAIEDCVQQEKYKAPATRHLGMN